MSRLGPTTLSLALAGAITLAAYTDPILVAVTVLLVQALVAAAPGLMGPTGAALPSPHTAAAMTTGVVATAITLRPDLLSGADGTSFEVVGASGTGLLAGILPAIGVGLFVSLVAQMMRKDGRAHLVQSTAYAVTLSVLSAVTVGWIGAVQSYGDAAAVAVGAAGVVGGLVIWMVPIDRWLCLSLAMLAGGVAGAGVTAAVDSIMTVYFGIVVGSAAALLAVVGQVIGRSMMRGHRGAAAEWGFPGAMSIVMAAPIVYIGGQLITVPGI